MGIRERRLVPAYSAHFDEPSLMLRTDIQLRYESSIAAAVYPKTVAQADVLIMLGGMSANAFVETRGIGPVEVLESAGITAACAMVKHADTLTELISDLRPRVVVNRAMVFRAEEIRTLSAMFPGVRFLTVNHSSQSDLIRTKGWITQQSEHVKLAGERRNCWFGVVDERNHISRVTGVDRCVWVPNCVRTPDPYPLMPISRPPRVSLSCVGRVLKNVPNQIIALGLAAQTCPLQAVLMMDQASDELAGLASLAGLNYEIAPWLPWSEFMDYVRDEIDVGVQCSFTESFNFIALEHMLHGKPVVGSPAIRYLPPGCRPNPDDPEAIANTLLRVLDNYETYSEQAKTIADNLAEANNRQFVDVIARVGGLRVVDRAPAVKAETAPL
jgi:glycosyltransferase involved in cell wall biosynthesis